ncbi:hypothetical protein HYC85_006152 [Camellia sinensis]|uniref:Uncharacterized protein n=1 Tax=Camellia sinensis TaxID=4442 RepID=A0A7J7HMW4_CAMSI|nr:hypothetical protein HYC85_006152 [Camellia sinensis]
MTSERGDFNLTGPLHLTDVDWKNVDHRRSVAVCLVQGVYILEQDRQENRQGPEALAAPWWELFHFRLHSQLVDDADHCSSDRKRAESPCKRKREISRQLET